VTSELLFASLQHRLLRDQPFEGLVIMSEVYDRPRYVLNFLSRNFPGAWNQINALRANRAEHGDWPNWCFVPLARVQEIVFKDSPALTAEQFKHLNFLGALAAWRSTQGIYRFHPATFDALWKTPVTGDIPTDVLYHLPEWCGYIPTPEKTWRGNVLNGFFAHLEHDLKTGRNVLRLLLDISTAEGNDKAVVMPLANGEHCGKP
jgi:hypothetical protein